MRAHINVFICVWTSQGLYRLQGPRTTGWTSYKCHVCCCMCSCVLHTLLYKHYRGWHEEAVSHSVSTEMRLYILTMSVTSTRLLSFCLTECHTVSLLASCRPLSVSHPPSLHSCLSLSLVGVIESSWAVRENTWCHFIGCKCLCSRLTINLQSANTCTCDFEHRPLWLPWPLSARWPELRHTPLHTHLTCIHF